MIASTEAFRFAAVAWLRELQAATDRRTSARLSGALVVAAVAAIPAAFYVGGLGFYLDDRSPLAGLVCRSGKRRARARRRVRLAPRLRRRRLAPRGLARRRRRGHCPQCPLLRGRCASFDRRCHRPLVSETQWLRKRIH